MAKFLLGCKVTVSAYTEVESETLEDAIEEAEGREVAMGGVNSGNSPDEFWIIDDADGSPQDIRGD
jgi:hypothetical protein